MYQEIPNSGAFCCQQRVVSGKQQSYEIWDLREKIVCLFLMGIITAAGISKLMYALSQQGIYFGALRIVYDWTKLYL